MRSTAKKKVNPTAALVDEFAQVKQEYKELERRYKSLRNQILALGQDICMGTNCKAVLLERTRNSLDSATLKADYGEEWYKSYCKETNYYEIEVIYG